MIANLKVFILPVGSKRTLINVSAKCADMPAHIDFQESDWLSSSQPIGCVMGMCDKTYKGIFRFLFHCGATSVCHSFSCRRLTSKKQLWTFSRSTDTTTTLFYSRHNHSCARSKSVGILMLYSTVLWNMPSRKVCAFTYMNQ